MIGPLLGAKDWALKWSGWAGPSGAGLGPGKKICLINGSGAAHGSWPTSRVRIWKNPNRTQPVAIPSTNLTLRSTNITYDCTFVTFDGSLIFLLTFYGTILTLSSINITCNCTFITFNNFLIFFLHLMVLFSHYAASASHVTALLSHSLIVLFSLTFNGTIFTLSSTTVMHFCIIKNGFTFPTIPRAIPQIPAIDLI